MGRRLTAVLASVPLGILLVYFGLVAVLTILQQVLAGFIDLGQATWTSFLNPAVVLGLESPGGTGGILDSLFGGPGAPGGTVNRYFVFMVAGVIAYGSFMLIAALWRWAGEAREVTQ
ncbi:MAG: hypothetical protein WCI74_15905 [Actinomycetes bacterium]